MAVLLAGIGGRLAIDDDVTDDAVAKIEDHRPGCGQSKANLLAAGHAYRRRGERDFQAIAQLGDLRGARPRQFARDTRFRGGCQQRAGD